MSTYTATETKEILARFHRFMEALDWHPTDMENA